MSEAVESMSTAVPFEETGPIETTSPVPVQSPQAPENPQTAAGEPAGEGVGEGGDPKKAEASPDHPADKPGEDGAIKPEDAQEGSRDKAEEVLSQKKLDITEFEKEFDATGTLSEESYKKLETAGLGKEVVDSYIEGRKALLDAYITEIKGMAGGEEGYAHVTAGAATHRQPGEVEAFNRIVNSGDRGLIRLAVSGLVSKYRESEGAAPNLVTGRASAGNRRDDGLFASVEEVKAAMRDPRYGKDPAYTHAVERRIARSHVFGN